MKKYTAPELSVSKFEVEDVITTSAIADTNPIYYNSGDSKNVDYSKTVNYAEIFA